MGWCCCLFGFALVVSLLLVVLVGCFPFWLCDSVLTGACGGLIILVFAAFRFDYWWLIFSWFVWYLLVVDYFICLMSCFALGWVNFGFGCLVCWHYAFGVDLGASSGFALVCFVFICGWDWLTFRWLWVWFLWVGYLLITS